MNKLRQQRCLHTKKSEIKAALANARAAEAKLAAIARTRRPTEAEQEAARRAYAVAARAVASTGEGTIAEVHTRGSITAVVFEHACTKERTTLHGDSRLTLDALCTIFGSVQAAIGRRVEFEADGSLLVRLAGVGA